MNGNFKHSERIRIIAGLFLSFFLILSLAGCASKAPEEVPEEIPETGEETEEIPMEKELRLYIDDTEVQVAWEDNRSVQALKELASEGELQIGMSMYGGFEQVGDIGSSLPRDDSRTVTEAGDIVLYSGDQIVVFYGSNSWSYTRLGKITDRTPEQMGELLGNGDVTLRIVYGG